MVLVAARIIVDAPPEGLAEPPDAVLLSPIRKAPVPRVAVKVDNPLRSSVAEVSQ